MVYENHERMCISSEGDMMWKFTVVDACFTHDTAETGFLVHALISPQQGFYPGCAYETGNN